VPAGSYTVTASDSTAYSASAIFTVTSALSLNPIAGAGGSTVTLSGSSYTPTTSLTVTFDGTRLKTSGLCTTDASGYLLASNHCAFTVPAVAAGLHTVTASDGTYSGSATFTVTRGISLSPSAGAVGSSVTINGSGFAPFDTIALTFDRSSVSVTASGVTACTTDASGRFSSCTFIVPPKTAGSYTVTATDRSANSASASYTVKPLIRLTSSAGTSVGAVGSTVLLSGSNYTPGSSLTVTFDGTRLKTSGLCTMDASGNLPASNNCAFTVPDVRAGIHNVAASDSNANSASAIFTV
jgi:uncharacterized protein (DUF2141 family)